MENSLRDILIDIATTAFENREVPQNIDWPLVFNAATPHGLFPLAQRSYKQTNGVTGESATSPHSDRLIVAARYMHLLHHFRRIVQALYSAGVTMIVLKGPVLAETVYPDPLLRPFSDLDLFCHEEDWATIYHTLVNLEFTALVDLPNPPAKPWCRKAYYHNQYFNQKTNVVVEIHFDLWQLGFHPRTEDLIWKRATTVTIAGLEVKSLSVEDQILHLCVHLQHHSYRKLIWFVDLALLLRRHKGQLDWDYLVQAARAEELTLPVYYSLHYLERFLGVCAPAAAMASLKPGVLRAKLHDRVWPPERVLQLDVDREIELQWREVPVARELLFSVLLLGHVAETLVHLSRLVVPPGEWLARYYSTSDPSVLRRRRLVHAPKMILGAARNLAATLRDGMQPPHREEHIIYLDR